MASQETAWSVDDPAFSGHNFRVYEFKVKRCPRARPHDWTQCPFAHPGEKAKRRDPRRYKYSGTACPDYRKNGTCARGDACPLAHGVFESWLHPARYKTQMCTDGAACQRRVCFFAHTEAELRKPEEDPVLGGLTTDLTADAVQQVLQQQQLANTLAALLGQGVASQPAALPGNPLAAYNGTSGPVASGGGGGPQALLQARLLQLQHVQAAQRQQAQHMLRLQQAQDVGLASLDPAAIQKQIASLTSLLVQRNALQLASGLPSSASSAGMAGNATAGLDINTLALLQQQLSSAAGVDASMASTPRASGGFDAETVFGHAAHMPGSSLPMAGGLNQYPDALASLASKPLERRLSLDSRRLPPSGGIPAWHGNALATAAAEYATAGGAGGVGPGLAGGAPSNLSKAGSTDAALAALLKSMSLNGGGAADLPAGMAGVDGGAGVPVDSSAGGYPPQGSYSLTTCKSVDNGVLARMSELAQLSDAELDQLEASLPGLTGALGGVPSGGTGLGPLPSVPEAGPPSPHAFGAGEYDAEGGDGCPANGGNGGDRETTVREAALGSLISLLGKNGGEGRLGGMVRNQSIDCLLAELPRSLSEMNLSAAAAVQSGSAAAANAAVAEDLGPGGTHA